MANQEELSILVDGLLVSGWQDIRVTRGIERFPSDFQIMVTEKNSIPQVEPTFHPGSSCAVSLGSDVVLTGYLDEVSPSISGNKHTVLLRGRSKCQDVVDCSAILPNSQIMGSTITKLATELCAPYDVKVEDLTQGLSDSFPTFNVNLGETPYEIIERVARSLQLLVYDNPRGELVLVRASGEPGKERNGVMEGQNVQSASISYSRDRRYSEYVVVAQSVATQQDQMEALGVQDYNVAAVSIDRGVTRFRRLYLVGEQFENLKSMAQRRADWENNRRWGRSYTVRAVVDNWRDTDGTLWQPNTTVGVNLPSLYMADKRLLITEVSYMRNLAGGTFSELTLMPEEAFAVQPTTLSPINGDLAAALAEASGSETAPAQEPAP
jgi:prophage tail gpP-like protein